MAGASLVPEKSRTTMAGADPRAIYEALVSRHGGDLYRFAYRLVGDATRAEDLVQETYFHAWRSIRSLRDPEAGRGWLLTILRRRWARGLRREARAPRTSTDQADIDGAASPFPGPDLDLFARRESVQIALDHLDPRMKEPFLLVFLQGLSCREAADRLSIPLGTVLSRIHRARASLRVLLRDTDQVGPGTSDEVRASSGGPS